MYYANIQPILEAVKNIEKQDLRRALESHGGSFSFEDTDPCPVEFYDDFHGPTAGNVISAHLKDDKIILNIEDEDSNIYDIEVDDLYPGMMSGITDRLPEPGEDQEDDE